MSFQQLYQKILEHKPIFEIAKPVDGNGTDMAEVSTLIQG